MSRYEYLKILENHLKLSLSKNEINDILRDYGEYFTEGENQGKTEWEIIAKLGDPKEVAQQIISESHKGNEKGSKTRILARIAGALKRAAEAVSSFVKTSSGKITFILLVLLCAPLWIGACAALLSIIAAFFGGLASLAILCIAVVLFGIASVVTTSLFMSVLPFTVILLLLIFSVGLVAGGILGLSLLLIAFNWGLKLILQLYHWLKAYLSSKTGEPVIDMNTVLK